MVWKHTFVFVCVFHKPTCIIYSKSEKEKKKTLHVFVYKKQSFAFSSAQLFSPMTALAMVIFNHILSRISRPESGSCITLTIVAMSVLLADRGKSSNSGIKKKERVYWKILTSRTVELLQGYNVVVVFTIVWVRSCQGGGVWNPGCRVNGSDWFG